MKDLISIFSTTKICMLYANNSKNPPKFPGIPLFTCCWKDSCRKWLFGRTCWLPDADPLTISISKLANNWLICAFQGGYCGCLESLLPHVAHFKSCLQKCKFKIFTKTGFQRGTWLKHLTGHKQNTRMTLELHFTLNLFSCNFR